MIRSEPTPPAIRKPFVSGHFYPGEPAGLRRDVDSFLQPAEGGPRAARGVVVPHAGYMYSGSVAGAVYATAILPRRVVLLGPNHTGLGRPIAVMNRGCWETPLGPAIIDEPLADLILDVAPIAENDGAAHRAEHSIEVQIPFLQVHRANFVFTPICVGTGRLADLLTLGSAIAAAVKSLGEPVGIVISSDMTHYEPADVAREKDLEVIAKMEKLDSEGLHNIVREKGISMCGYAPATAGLHALRTLGATKAELIAYANSGETSGDLNEVVGYAGLLIS